MGFSDFLFVQAISGTWNDISEVESSIWKGLLRMLHVIITASLFLGLIVYGSIFKRWLISWIVTGIWIILEFAHIFGNGHSREEKKK